MKRFRLLGFFALIAAGIGIFLWRGSGQKDAVEKPNLDQSVPATRILVTPVTFTTFQQKVSLAGNVEALETALVSARIPGVLDAIYVDEGDHVKKGETPLFQTDSLKLTQAVEISEKGLEVAECAVRERQANLSRVETDLAKAKMDYERFKRLYEEDRAVTLNAYEIQESRFQQLTAALKQAQEAVALSQKQREQAESGLTIARKDLADSRVLAPIDGVVVERLKEPGELAGAGVPVVRIEDPSVIEISCFLVAEHFGRVRENETVMSCSVRDQKLQEKVSYVSPVIHPALRTFEVKCRTQSPPPGMVPGALVNIEMLLAQREGLAVPSGAVRTREGKSIVFAARNGRALSVPVRTGLTTDGLVEIIDGDLAEGDEVVTEGQYLLDDGAPIVKAAEK